MENRERFNRVMRYQSVDHPPLLAPGPWVSTRRRWEREGCPAGVDLHEYFGLPPFRLASVGIDTLMIPPFKEIILEDKGEFVIKIDRHGARVRNFKEEDSMPEFLEYAIKGQESLPWLREKFELKAPGRVTPDWLAKARQVRERGGLLFINGGMYFGFLNEHMGTEHLLVAYFDDPAFIHAVNELQCSACEFALNTALPEFKIDCVAYHEDMAYRNGSMISPAMFREFMTPYYKRIQAIAVRHGIDLQFLDSDGNVEELIPLWLEVGINILTPMEVAAGMDVVRLRKKFGRELRMFGGFDKRILAAGKKQIRAELERLRPLIEDGGYIPGIDHGTPPDVSWVNACCYVETLKGMFGM